MSLGANEAPVHELVEYMKANIEELNKVYLEWPNYNEPLDMPCAAVMTVGSPSYTPQMPVLWKNIAGQSYYFVGFYDLTFEVDLWAEYKQARGDLMERVFDLFDKQFLDSGKSLGISLPLEEYHNTIARYDLNGYTYNDNEEGSQRDEWRSRLSVVVNFQRVMIKAESIISVIETVGEVEGSEIVVDTDIVI